MKICSLKIFMCVILACLVRAEGFCGPSAELKRQIANDENLAALKAHLEKKPTLPLTFVFDLHDTILTRKSGDIQRARQLTNRQLLMFLWRLTPFGIKYLGYKLRINYHPNLEYHLADLLTTTSYRPLLDLISPFELNTDMRALCLHLKEKKYKVFACSNMGTQSYEYMDEQFKLSELFDGMQLATPENGYLQKDRRETYEALYKKITAAHAEAPEAVVMFDDRDDNIQRCRTVFAELGCPVYGFIFKTYHDFCDACTKYGLEKFLPPAASTAEPHG